MSAHPIGSATLSFGLVSVPVKLFSTGEASAAVSFNWLHKKDGARLKKQYVVAVRPEANGLVMEQLRYANEVRTIADVPIPKIEVKKTELQLATQLVEQAASDAFHPEAYEDNVRKRVLELIQKKVEGEEITEEPTEAPKTQIIDLMEALKASLKAKGTAGERKPAKRVERKAVAKVAPIAKRKVGGARG